MIKVRWNDPGLKKGVGLKKMCGTQEKRDDNHLDLLQVHQTIPIGVPELGELLSFTSDPVRF